MYKLEKGIDESCRRFARDNDLDFVTKGNFHLIQFNQYKQDIIDNCKSKIKEKYILDHYEYVFNKIPEYDGILIFNKKDEVCGFLFTKIIKCSNLNYNNQPILNLICSKKCTTKTKTTVSRLMMYIYLNSLLQHSFKYGMLELADGVNNAAGYCLYSKYGFKEDIELAKCVSGICLKMLPMSVDITTLSERKLQDITFNNVDVFSKKIRMSFRKLFKI